MQSILDAASKGDMPRLLKLIMNKRLDCDNLYDISESLSELGYRDAVDLVVEQAIEDGCDIPLDLLAIRAAQYGRSEIVYDMIDRGVNNYEQLAAVARLHGHHLLARSLSIYSNRR